MGIKDLISKVFPADMKVQSSFEVLKSKTMGVDVSNYMFKLVTTRDSLVRDFHSEPRIEVSGYIHKFWDAFKKLCDSFAIRIVLVLDGRRNPAKLDTNNERDSKRNEALQKLNALFLEGDEDDSDEVLQIQKSMMTISEDMLLDVKNWARENDVICIQSLYEADAGLQHLEEMGLTDGTFSEDGDFFPLNSKMWATKVNVSKGTLTLFNSEKIRQALSEKFFPGGDVVMTPDHGRILSVLLGCDFLPRPFGYGPKNAEKFVMQWMTSTMEENNRSLLAIEVGKKKRKSAGSDLLKEDAIPGYFKSFWMAFNMLKHPPVFKFSTLSDDAIVHVGLLGIEDLSLSTEFVTAKLGFDAFQDTTLLGDFRELLFIKDNIFVRTGMPLLPILQPRNEQGLLLPWGCTHNFTKWPPKMCTSDMLNRWLRSRGVRYSPQVSHAELVQATVSLIREVPLRDIIPLDNIPEEADFDAGIGGVRWILDRDSVFNQIRDLEITPNLDKDFLDEVFGHRGGVENRAMRLIAGGHFDLMTIKSCKTNCRINGVMTPCIMFQIQSTPSMKANAYEVNIIFKTGTDESAVIGARYIRSPYSHCDCPAGQMFCSHMLGFLGILRVIQQKVLITHTAAKSIFPQSVKALSSTGILLEFVY